MKALLGSLILIGFFAFICGSILIVSSARVAPADPPFAAPLAEQDEKSLLPCRTRLIEHTLIREKNRTLDYCVSADATKAEILTLAFTLRDDLKAQGPQRSMLIRIHNSMSGFEPFDVARFNATCVCSMNYVHDLDHYYVQWGF